MNSNPAGSWIGYVVKLSGSVVAAGMTELLDVEFLERISTKSARR